MIVPAHNPRDTGIRKAAILVASLDRAAAERLLEQLGPECAALVRQAVASVERIDAYERRRVIDEFRRIEALVPDKCPAGIDLDGPESRQLARPAAAGSTDADPPFSFLRDAAEEQLSSLLGGERPQTIAVVLSQLPPERAGTVLGRLPPLRQVEVVRRLAELDGSDPETLREIEQTLLARLSRQFAIERKRAAGPETIAKILAACDTRLSAKILTNLAQHDRPLAERLVARPLCSENYPPRTTRAA
jgi:flagellar motor switch protein FliG